MYGGYNCKVDNTHQWTSNDLVSTKATTLVAHRQMLKKLKSLISQKLQPTFDLSGLTGGLLGGAGGDTFDETHTSGWRPWRCDQKELQIHANDANWQDTFQKAGLTDLSPEDAQARAKELVEAYSKGLDSHRSTKEAIKDSIRQAIKADELFQSMVDEIYAEMGKPKPETNIGG